MGAVNKPKIDAVIGWKQQSFRAKGEMPKRSQKKNRPDQPA